MDIRAKDIKIYLWRFLGFSSRTLSFYVKKYPLASAVLALLLLLYLFFPFVFKLLVYTVPVLVCIAAGISRHLSYGKVKDFKGKGKVYRDFSKSESAQDGNLVRRPKKPLICAQMSKRRNFKTKREDLSAQEPSEVIPAKFSIPDDSFIGKAEKTMEIQNPIIGEPESCPVVAPVESSENAESLDGRAPLSGSVSEAQKDDIGLGEETSKSLGDGEPSTSQLERDLEEAEDDEEEDQAQDDGNRVVEWNEDDQKNVMDLGFSELERNRRLENLIAKRRARKMVTVALRSPPNLPDLDGNAPSGHVPHIQITKNNPFDNLPSGDEEEMLDPQIPGSAPSVLLPARNPFDIPYDPLEEKPNLTADGFQQEFSASTQPRDIFCRHESFTLGPFFSAEIYEDQVLVGPSFYSRPDWQVPSESRLWRFRRLADKGDNDKLDKKILCHEHNCSDREQKESKSPQELSKAIEIRQEGNVENGDSPGERLGDESGKDMGPNISPENKALTKPEEGYVKSNSSSTSEEQEQEVILKDSSEGQDTIEMGKLGHFPNEHLGDESGVDMELNISPKNEALTEPEEVDVKSNSSSISEGHKQGVTLKESSEGQDTLEMGKLDCFLKEHLGDESGNDMELNLSPKHEGLTEPEERNVKSNSPSTSEEHEQEVMLKESSEGQKTQDTLEMGNLENLPKEPDTPEEGSPIASGSGTANVPFCGSTQSIIEYLDRGVGHSTTYSIASDMLVEVSETGSPRNIPDDILSPPDVLEDNELRNKLHQADYHHKEDAVDLSLPGVKEHLTDPFQLFVSNKNMDEEDSAGEIKTSSSSPSPNHEGHSDGQVGSTEGMYTDEESKEIKLRCPDFLEVKIPEETMQFIDNSLSHEPEEIPIPPDSSSVQIGYEPDEIIENSNLDENGNGPPQHIADEIRDKTEQDIIPHSGRLEENEDINPCASPMEEADITCTSVASTSQRAEDGYIKPESAEGGLKGEIQTQT